MEDSAAISFTGSRQQCFCQLFNESLPSFSFNYFSHNQTCRFYLKTDQNKSFVLLSHASSTFYFLSLPLQNASILPTTLSIEYSWTFDSNSLVLDRSQTFNCSTIRCFLHSRSDFSKSLPQPSKPFMELPTSLGSIDLAIIGQCDTIATRRCLHLNVPSAKIYVFENRSIGSQHLVSYYICLSLPDRQPIDLH